MQKLAICRTDSNGCGLWNTKSWRSTSLESLLILPLSMHHNDLLQGRRKVGLMCLWTELPPHLKFLLPIYSSWLTLELVEGGQQRQEPCPQAGVPSTLLPRGLISCRVLGERAVVLKQEKQGCKSNRNMEYLLLNRHWKVECPNRNGWNISFQPCMLVGSQLRF